VVQGGACSSIPLGGPEYARGLLYGVGILSACLSHALQRTLDLAPPPTQGAWRGTSWPWEERCGPAALRGVRSALPARRCAGLATLGDVNASPEASEDTTPRRKQAVAGQHLSARCAQELSSWLCYAELRSAAPDDVRRDALVCDDARSRHRILFT
jgi:hypothetical protein